MTAQHLLPCAALAALLLAAGCGQGEAPAPQSQAEYRPVATVRDIMTGMLEPSAEAIWQSVATVITATGTEERAPRTDEEWAALRRHALQLVEASNLLQMPGRAMARAGEQSAFPGIELGPEEIQALVDKDRAGWLMRARALGTALAPTLDAINAKNAKLLEEAGEPLDTACENCHLQYWYPNAPEPPDLPAAGGSPSGS